MVIQYNLSVVRRKYFISLYGFFSILLQVRVNVNDFPVSLISEQQSALSTAGINLEVRRIVTGTYPCLPVVVTEICRFRHQLNFSLKDRLEVLNLQPMRIIDISRNLYFFSRVLNSQVNYGQEPTIQDFLFSFSQCLQERTSLKMGDSRC